MDSCCSIKAKKMSITLQAMLTGSLLLLLLSLHITESKKVGTCLRNVQGSRCSQPGASWQHDGACIIEPSKPPACHVPDTRNFKFLLVANIRQKVRTQSITSLWVAGSGPSLSWDKPKQMRKSGRNANEWNIEVSYSSDSNALLCLNASYCTLNQHGLELRVYRDPTGSADMLGPNIYIPLPVTGSMSGVLGFTPPKVTVYPWFDCAIVKTKLMHLSFKSYISRADQTIHINSTLIYPPSFVCNIKKQYPLVIMFGEKEPLQIAPLLEHVFVHEASTKEAVVVSIHYLDKAPFCAFNPFNEDIYMSRKNLIWDCKARDTKCHSCQTCWDPQRINKCTAAEFTSKTKTCLARYSCSGRATDILDFIEHTLLPEVRKRTHGRLLLDFPRQRMSIIGFSGAGTLACFAALSRPMYYSNAACLSANFQWPVHEQALTSNRNREGIGRFMQELNTTLGMDPARKALYASQKYYIDTGEHDNFHTPHIDAHNYAEWVIGLLKNTLHLKSDKNILYFNIPKAGNSYYRHKDGGTEVFNRIRQPLLFFLGAEGGPNKKFPRVPRLGQNSFAERQGEIGMTEKDLEAVISSSNRKNKSLSGGGHCLFGHQRIHSQNRKPSVPVPVFILSIVLSILVAVLLTAAFMYLREMNKKAEAKEKAEEDMDDMGSSLGDLDDLDELSET